KGVQDAVVVFQDEHAGHERLVAYVVPAAHTALPVRQALKLEKAGLAEGKELTRLPNGMIVRHHRKNEVEFLYKEIFEEQSYWRRGVALPDGAWVLEVGANIGMFSLFVSQKCRNSSIYPFEPIPPVFEILKTNVSLHGLNAKIYNAGVANQKKKEAFTFYHNLSMMSGRYTDLTEDLEIVRSYETNQQSKSPEAGRELNGQLMDEMLSQRLTSERFMCELVSISDVIRENCVERIDLLKIDAEK